VRFLFLALLAVGTLSLAGCGGISATRSVSPLDFLMPGIIKSDPPQTNAPVAAIQISVVRVTAL
jgi:hypothetical protein